MELLAFNTGLEVGQLLIVIALLFITFVALSLVKVNRREYILILSGGILGFALQMALQRLPF